MSDPETAQNASCMSQILSYFRTRKGAILLSESVLCLIILICFAASRSPGYLGVAITELIFCIVFYIIFAVQFNQQLQFIHWGWTDFLRAAIGSALLIITSIISLVRGGDGAAIAGAVFGLLTGILFAYDAYTTFPQLRRTHAPAATEPQDSP
ncbi:proteolipid protein 2 [Spea bombifrons]|uniref:proteolipid protein 2 n=1 Tax=Spea bombifrons TaxID=233779 RepID=UPI002348F734|nr:proteolipid protein 2 [Spea bombifrons]